MKTLQTRRDLFAAPWGRWWAAGLLLLALLVAFAAWLRADRRAAHRATDRAGTQTALGRAPRSGRSGDLPAFVPSGPPPGANLEERTPTAGPGRHFGFYGGRSGRLSEGRRVAVGGPITQVSSVEHRPTLEVWVPSTRAQPEGTTIFARVGPLDRETALLAPPEVTVTPAGGAGDEASVTMEPVSGGRGLLPEFRTRFVPPPAGEGGARTPLPPRQFRYQVVLRGIRSGERFERRAGGLFFVHDPGALFDRDSATVAQIDGDLSVTLRAEVRRPGTYFVFAELWGGPRGDRAIAFARDRLTKVAAGTRPIELRFGGRILHDASVDGPYVIRNIRLQQVDTHPAHEAEPIAALPPTPAWRAADFH